MSITSANSVFMLAIPGLYPVPQQLQGYAADDAFTTTPVKLTESVIGVDGRKSSGFVFSLYEMEITLQADSPSRRIFDYWAQAMRVARDDYPANATISLPGISKAFTLSNGSLEEYPVMPDAKKTLQPTKYKITWESITPAIL